MLHSAVTDNVRNLLYSDIARYISIYSVIPAVSVFIMFGV